MSNQDPPQRHRAHREHPKNRIGEICGFIFSGLLRVLRVSVVQIRAKQSQKAVVGGR
jgi:hypothetical protein